MQITPCMQTVQNCLKLVELVWVAKMKPFYYFFLFWGGGLFSPEEVKGFMIATVYVWMSEYITRQLVKLVPYWTEWVWVNKWVGDWI